MHDGEIGNNFSAHSHTLLCFREASEVFSSHHEGSCLCGKTTGQPLLMSRRCHLRRDLWSMLGMSTAAALVWAVFPGARAHCTGLSLLSLQAG